MKSRINSLIIPFTDLWKMILYRRKSFIFCMSMCAILFLGMKLISPAKFNAEGSFHVKDDRTSSVTSGGVMALLSGGGSKSDSNPAPFMTSPQILDKVIDELNLQAIVKEKTKGKLSQLLSNAKDNLEITWKSINRKSRLDLEDLKKPALICSSVQYEDELPQGFKVTFQDSTTFQVTGKKGMSLTKGKLGTPTQGENFSFILTSTEPVKQGARYSFTLLPKESLYKKIENTLNIEVDKRNPNFYLVSYTDRDRHLATNIVNNVMRHYQAYLQTEMDLKQKEQLNYLNERQEQLQESFKNTLSEQKNEMNASANKSGFLNYENESRNLVLNQNKLIERLRQINLEIQKLEDTENSYNKFLDYDNSQSIRSLTTEIEKYKQRRQQLEYSLKQYYEDENLEQDLKYFENLEAKSTHLKQLLLNLEKANLPYSEELLQRINELKPPAVLIPSLESKNLYHDHLVQYLKNTLQHYELEQEALRERLAHPNKQYPEFADLDIEKAEELLIKFNAQITNNQLKNQQLQANLEQMQKESFDPSSLSSSLQDTVSESIITKISDLNRKIHNPTYYSSKEITRIEEQAQLEQAYLQLHLEQKLALSLQHDSVLQFKLNKIKKLLVNLLSDQLVINQKQISEYTDLRIKNLKLERRLVEMEALSNKESMSFLPEKWALEQELAFSSTLGQQSINALNNLVETATLNSKIKRIESAPIKKAITPIYAQANKLFLFFLIGAFLGFLLALTLLFFHIMSKGVIISKENINLAGFKYGGLVTPQFFPKNFAEESESTISTLRLLNSQIQEKTVLLLQSTQHKYEKMIAELQSKAGKRVLLISLSFKQKLNEEAMGLSDYLENTVTKLPILHHPFYDELAMGSSNINLTEYLQSSKMKDLLDSFKESYQKIIFSTDLHFSSSEASALLPLAQEVIVSCAEDDYLYPLIFFSERYEQVSTICLLSQTIKPLSYYQRFKQKASLKLRPSY
jgi:hypothetical protein